MLSQATVWDSLSAPVLLTGQSTHCSALLHCLTRSLDEPKHALGEYSPLCVTLYFFLWLNSKKLLTVWLKIMCKHLLVHDSVSTEWYFTVLPLYSVGVIKVLPIVVTLCGLPSGWCTYWTFDTYLQRIYVIRSPRSHVHTFFFKISSISWSSYYIINCGMLRFYYNHYIEILWITHWKSSHWCCV